MRTIKEKIGMTFSLLFMWPMLSDAPGTKDIFKWVGVALKEIWFSKNE